MGYAGIILFAGLFIFLLVPAKAGGLVTKRQKMFRDLFAVLAPLSFSCPHVCNFLSVDKCLDKGGKWNYNLAKCEFN